MPAPFRVTFPGEAESEKSPAAGGVTVSVAVLSTPLYDALMVTVAVVVTGFVVTAKSALVAPAATVTGERTVAAGESLDRVTVTPPNGAGALSVTVPVDGLPPTTLVGLRLTEDSAGVLEPEQSGKLKEAIRVLQALPLVG